ncbi:MAG TPA: cation diffusion facilitator family transporter [Verrucomicrobiae bacterium]|nr:cation diffusion facilitator family transporter [Verrucomicrobiae bacterium]
MHLHAHDHAGRDHEHAHHLGASSTAVLGLSVVATFALVLIELLAGYAAHSMALISDAVHNLTDVPTLVISWLAMRWALRPPTHEKTFGYHRAGILAAFVNAIVLTLAAFFVLAESIARLRAPVEVGTSLMLWVSLVALVINGGITLGVTRGRHDLNVRTVWIHNLGDAFSNIGVLVGAVIIRWTGARWIDALIGIGIGVMVLWSARGILRESGHILLEGLPRAMSLEKVAAAMLRVHGVQEVHDVHIWTLGTDLHALACHVRIPDMHMEESEKILKNIRDALAREFHITHTTIQFERAGLPAEAGLYMPAPARRSAK